MLVILALHAAIGGGLLLGARHLGRAAFALGAVPMVAALAFLGLRWDVVAGGDVHTERVVWVGGLDLAIDVRLDGFAALMVLLVAGMGVLVLAFGASYFPQAASSARIAGLLVLFAASMLGLVLADNLIWLYACWELTSVTSYLLIGREQRSAEQRAAALQALLVTGAGGLAMLAGFVVLARESGTWSLFAILTDPPAGGAVGIGLALVVAGIVTKSAQYPFHFWLPGAMVAPTPISAYLHSATMVKAGIYLAARLAPAFAVVGVWRPALIAIGLLTMVGGALRALRQQDLKLLLAHGTVSQLGFMLVLAATGWPGATKAVCVLLLAHALFKGALFLVVGIVDHETGTRDRDEIRVGGAGWGAVRIAAVVSAASMAGVPPLAGFLAKESAYEAFTGEGTTGALVLVGLVAGSALTFAYSVRFALPFIRPLPCPADGARPAGRFVAPAALLAATTAIVGLAPFVVADLVSAAANSLDAAVGKPKLALWHGLNAALGLSMLTFALGGVLVAARARVARVQGALSPGWYADDVFGAVVHGVNVMARRVTATVQPGSLPLAVGIILTVVVGVPAGASLAGGWDPGDWGPVSETPGQVLLAAVLVVGAVAVATARRRFAAVLVLGSVGYGMALVFAVQGAPDLALTQFAVETLSIVVFMLVIRHLPARFGARPLRAANLLRLGVAGFVAAGVFVLAMSTSGGTDARATSEEIVARAEPDGGGQNVVNVILVDVRALDTLGEITVLAVSAVGVVAVARVGRRPRASSPSSSRTADPAEVSP